MSVKCCVLGSLFPFFVLLSCLIFCYLIFDLQVSAGESPTAARVDFVAEKRSAANLTRQTNDDKY